MSKFNSEQVGIIIDKFIIASLIFIGLAKTSIDNLKSELPFHLEVVLVALLILTSCRILVNIFKTYKRS